MDFSILVQMDAFSFGLFFPKTAVSVHFRTSKPRFLLESCWNWKTCRTMSYLFFYGAYRAIQTVRDRQHLLNENLVFINFFQKVQ